MPDFGVPQTSTVRLAVLSGIVGSLARKGFRRVSVLEVGSYEGESAINWRRSVALLPEGGEVFCVDPWEPYQTAEELSGDPAYKKIAADLSAGKVYERFRRNTDEGWTAAVPIRHHRGTLASAPVSGRTWDIVYIDGCHHYKAVLDDIRRARSLVTLGGVMCGDDLERQIELGGIDESLAISHSDVDFWDGHHPGVSLAVAREFGRVWSSHGTWAVPRSVDGRWLPGEEP